jgi:hypothetical protein
VGHALPEDSFQDAMAWLAEKAREPYPAQVVYNQAEFASSYYDNLFFNEVWKSNDYWVRIDERVDDALPARAAGSVDGDTLVIDAENVAALTVLLADELVSLDAPVSIEVNGEALFEGAVARDPVFALEHARARDERSMVFANAASMDVP